MNLIKDLDKYLVYQPKVDLKTLEIIGLEALIRFLEPRSKETLNTENIINSITDVSELIELTNEVFDIVISDMKRLDELNFKTRISINMTAKELCDINLAVWINEKLKKNKKYINRIEIEIIEKYEVKNELIMRERINLLREYGFIVSIDDLGSGYNQIEMIKNYDVDLIKIDRSMVRNFKSRYEELKYIINISKRSNIKILVEGIESEKDLKRFLDLGVEFGQGYYFYKPMRLDEILEKINLINDIKTKI